MTRRSSTGTAPRPGTHGLPRHVRVAVIGAGFSGLGTAIQLERAGRPDFIVIEKGGDVGGTWRDNTYPGAACDVPSQLYSFSFALNPEWSSSFSPQPEIQAYLRRTAADAGVLDRFRFRTTLTRAVWHEDAQRWELSVSDADGEHTLTADVLVSATGSLSEPKLPDIDGIEGFGGEIFHSARWNHDIDLSGKRVAVIGTGASAIQIVPELARTVGRLDVYQRTAPWVIPRHDRHYTALERIGFRHVPGLMMLYRAAIYWGRELFVPAFTWQPALAKPAELAARRNIAKGISDPELRRRVTPDFRIGCKRILVSNDYYPALDAGHVHLIDTRIARATETGIVDADGVSRDVDAIVVATGFHVTDPPVAHRITGRDGQTLEQAWASRGMRSLKGATVHGFPNFLQLIGPNTGLGHGSMVFMIESQIRYLLEMLGALDAHDLGAVAPTAEAQDRWSDDIQRRMPSTVWARGGCTSWYLDEHGNNTTLWPRSTFAFRRLLSRFDLDDHDVVPRRQIRLDAPSPTPAKEATPA